VVGQSNIGFMATAFLQKSLRRKLNAERIKMNRLLLTLKYPFHRWWADYFIYFYRADKTTACILDTRTDELVEDYRKENEN
jgi:hypothetical protein